MPRLILGSSSPRRQELLKQLAIPFTIRKPQIDESIVTITDPIEKVEKLALLKARSLALQSKNELIITADTIVSYENTIFEKPKDKQEAYHMIKALSGDKHHVITAVALRSYEEEIVFSVQTAVYFWELTDEEITAYVATDEPYDKSGAYGIQGKAAIFVRKIDGDYFNVVGLPISSLIRYLQQFNVPIYDYMFTQY